MTQQFQILRYMPTECTYGHQEYCTEMISQKPEPKLFFYNRINYGIFMHGNTMRINKLSKCNNKDESHKHLPEQRKPDTKDHTIHNAIY